MLTGDKILWESSPKGSKTFKAFSIKIKLTNREINDGSCVDYPTTEHLTYDACIDSYMKKKFHHVFGCNVPWMTTDAQCSGQIKKSAKRNYASGFLQYVLMRSLAHSALVRNEVERIVSHHVAVAMSEHVTRLARLEVTEE